MRDKKKFWTTKEIFNLLNESMSSDLDSRIESILNDYGITKLSIEVPHLPSNMTNAIGFRTGDNSILVVDEYNGYYSIGVVNQRMGIITGRPTGFESLEELVDELPGWLEERGFIK